MLPTHLRAQQGSTILIKDMTHNLSSPANGNINAENKTILYNQQQIFLALSVTTVLIFFLLKENIHSNVLGSTARFL